MRAYSNLRHDVTSIRTSHGEQQPPGSSPHLPPAQWRVKEDLGGRLSLRLRDAICWTITHVHIFMSCAYSEYIIKYLNVCVLVCVCAHVYYIYNVCVCL